MRRFKTDDANDTSCPTCVHMILIQKGTGLLIMGLRLALLGLCSLLAV